MSGNRWVVRLEKSEDGRVCLKFWGQFYNPVKCIIYVSITALVVLGSVVPYIVR